MGGIDDVRCPTCSRPLVLRSGPAITTHFAHRPRQSCRKGPGGVPGNAISDGTLRLEQLTLFDLEPLPAETVPALYWAPRPAERPPQTERPAPRHRRRRRAWLPRLIRWIRANAPAEY